MTPLCTIGYEGFSAEQWVERLITQRIEVVVDVRDVPISRKRGFSKTRLAELLAANGIEYVHLRALGNPKAYRERLKDGWAFDEFAQEFGQRLEGQDEVLDTLLDMVKRMRACLVCFEEDPAHCHRSIVAEKVVRRVSGGEIRHLRHAGA